MKLCIDLQLPPLRNLGLQTPRTRSEGAACCRASSSVRQGHVALCRACLQRNMQGCARTTARNSTAIACPFESAARMRSELRGGLAGEAHLAAFQSPKRVHGALRAVLRTQHHAPAPAKHGASPLRARFPNECRQARMRARPCKGGAVLAQAQISGRAARHNLAHTKI